MGKRGREREREGERGRESEREGERGREKEREGGERDSELGRENITRMICSLLLTSDIPSLKRRKVSL